jgi:prepilin-type N-terminal cleavage/methylation domain-containing protein
MLNLKRIFNRSRPCFKDNAAFSLVEILVAMAIFLVVSAGVTSMMLVSVRTTVDVRLGTMAKEAVQQELEAIRARTFYVPYSSDPDVGTTADVDVLDRYFPDTDVYPTTDSWGWEAWYTETSGDAYYTVQSPEDDNSIVIKVEMRFVDYAGNTVIPVDSYDSNVNGSDSPPSDLVSVVVTATWLSRGTEESYTLDSLISRADQTSQGGSDDGGGEAGCSFSSQSSIDVTGGTLTVYTGSSEPYTSLGNFEMGDASGTASYDCTSTMTAFGTGGSLSVVGGDIYSAAAASSLGPPQDSDSSGPVTVGPTGSWPKFYLDASTASASVESSDDEGQLSVASEASLDASTIQLQQVDGGISGSVFIYNRWDFINPVFEVQNSGAQAADINIEQENGVSTATGSVFYDEINFLPLQLSLGSAPSALQGLIIIRDFEAVAVSEASEANGSASNSVSYTATVGMFNLSKSSSCSGDSCYDFYSIDETNPIQSAINLSDSDYKLQNALLTEWYSYTSADIADAVYTADDGSEAMVSIDALMKVSSVFAAEVRQKTVGQKQVEVISTQGSAQLWLGSFDVSVLQND